MGTQSKETVALAAAKAEEAVSSTRNAAHQAMDKMADKVEDAEAGASRIGDKAAGIASAVADKTKDVLESAQDAVRVRASNVSKRVADYTEAEPVNAMLIAAATGAVLMALLSMMIRSRD